MSQVAIKST